MSSKIHFDAQIKRHFNLADFAEIESLLEEKSAEGLHFHSLVRDNYRFLKGPACKYYYNVRFLSATNKAASFIREYEALGWEFLDREKDLYFFRTTLDLSELRLNEEQKELVRPLAPDYSEFSSYESILSTIEGRVTNILMNCIWPIIGGLLMLFVVQVYLQIPLQIRMTYFYIGFALFVDLFSAFSLWRAKVANKEKKGLKITLADYGLVPDTQTASKRELSRGGLRDDQFSPLQRLLLLFIGFIMMACSFLLYNWFSGWLSYLLRS